MVRKKDSDNCLVSIVVPVYNAKNFINECVQSIIKQSFENLEIILVNDGSTDGSGKTCDKLAEKDSRIKVIHKRNEGVNYARRDGAKQSNADYIVFVDSDDVIQKNCIKTLYNVMVKYKVEFARCKHIEFSNKITWPKNQHSEVLLLNNKKDLIRTIIKSPEGYYTTTMWGAIYSRKIIDLINWEKCNYKYYEDNFFIFQVLDTTARAVFIPNALYGYRRLVNQSSSTHLIGNVHNNKPIGYLEMCNRIFEEKNRLNKKYQLNLDNEIITNKANAFAGYLKQLFDSDLHFSENNPDYLKEAYRAVFYELKNQIIIHQAQIQSLRKEVDNKQIEIDKLLNIKYSARRLAGNIKRKLSGKS